MKEDINEGDFRPWMIMRKQKWNNLAKEKVNKPEVRPWGSANSNAGSSHNHSSNQKALGSRFEVF